MFSKFFKILYEANGGSGDSGQSSNGESEAQEQSEEAPVNFKTFDEFYNSLSDEHKKIVSPAKSHFDKVYSTVDAVRGERESFSTELKAIRKKFGDNADVVAEIDKLTTGLDAATKKADFMEEAITEGCNNAKAAFALAMTGNLFTRSGAPDWKEIKAQAPQLFGSTERKTKKSTSGAGAGGDNNRGRSSGDMNSWIRSQANKEVVELLD